MTEGFLPFSYYLHLQYFLLTQDFLPVLNHLRDRVSLLLRISFILCVFMLGGFFFFIKIPSFPGFIFARCFSLAQDFLLDVGSFFLWGFFLIQIT